MARYSSCPRTGHLSHVIRIFGYLKHHPKHRIEFNHDSPNYSGLKLVRHNWAYHYPDAQEDLPDDMPDPVTSEVYITCYVDASHGCDLVTKRSITGILLCINKTPIKWYSKRQNTVESSTYGSELVAARIAVEMIMEYRYRLKMLGMKVTQPSVVFVDNESVVKNTSLPSSPLKKKHNAIAYHKVRECVAAGIVYVAKVKGHCNPADICTKPKGPQDMHRLLKGVLYTVPNSATQGELQRIVYSSDEHMNDKLACNTNDKKELKENYK